MLSENPLCCPAGAVQQICGIVPIGTEGNKCGICRRMQPDDR